MSQPPYPPQGGDPPGDDQPTDQFGAPPPEARPRDRTQQFGPAVYGQQPYGQPQYGPPQYGQAPYVQPLYGQPYGRPTRGRNGTVIALVIAGIVLLAGLGAALALIVGSRGNDLPTTVGASAAPSSAGSSSAESGIPPATVPPDGLGNEPLYDALAQDCYDGTMESCDALYAATKDDDSLGSYSDYADTCAGRQEGGTSEYCTDAFPGD